MGHRRRGLRRARLVRRRRRGVFILGAGYSSLLAGLIYACALHVLRRGFPCFIRAKLLWCAMAPRHAGWVKTSLLTSLQNLPGNMVAPDRQRIFLLSCHPANCATMRVAAFDFHSVFTGYWFGRFLFRRAALSRCTFLVFPPSRGMRCPLHCFGGHVVLW